ncbi:hypothetical protein GGI25_004339 [Coemansia spiralis]|uniref:Uncharacterized protein n=2 Tax=Coemansia TaxID=4863 RepID=A0A9W8G6S6_9FUNG|nr:hypothetical protein EDC05_003065 [Coemansia umbellata]KAJ2621424.1 hypothetical protein GGI26_004106 [Coemansia sp. RSA 1358]KAJ2674399.1 hypothetical protein GGI25_004339 [Coemansia spiralis]
MALRRCGRACCLAIDKAARLCFYLFIALIFAAATAAIFSFAWFHSRPKTLVAYDGNPSNGAPLPPGFPFIPGSYHNGKSLTYIRMAWQEMAWEQPFMYEAKVYISQLDSVPDDDGEFFDKAQMVWHIGPQNLENRYPLFRNSFTVNIPSSLYTTKPSRYSFTHVKPLFMFIFIQRVGQFTPHPNLKDPYILVGMVPIIEWRPQERITKRNGGAITTRIGDCTLFVQKSVNLALVLETHIFKPSHFPPYLLRANNSRAEEPYNTDLYLPPLHSNTFTNNIAPMQPLEAAENKDGITIYSPTFNIDMEIRGIQLGWLSAKESLTNLAKSISEASTNKTAHVLLKTTEGGIPTHSVVASFKGPLADKKASEFLDAQGKAEQYMVNKITTKGPLANKRILEFLMHHSILAVIVAGVCAIMVFILTLLVIRLQYKFYLGPISKLAGVSRVAIAISCLLTINDCAAKMYTIGILGNLYEFIPLILNIRILFRFFDPLNKLCSLFSRRSQPDNLQQLQVEAVDIGVKDDSLFGKEKPSRSVQRIKTAREQVDSFINRSAPICVPAIYGLLAIYVFIAGRYTDPWNYAYKSDFCAHQSGLLPILYSLLPQIAINYKVQSGSLIPPSIPFFKVATFCLVMVCRLAFKFEVYRVSFADYSEFLCYLVMFGQWLIYLKAKQD